VNRPQNNTSNATETTEAPKRSGLLHPATNEQTAAKVGIFGDTGSGKTTSGGLSYVRKLESLHTPSICTLAP
jgi:hypothetical protein